MRDWNLPVGQKMRSVPRLSLVHEYSPEHRAPKKCQRGVSHRTVANPHLGHEAPLKRDETNYHCRELSETLVPFNQYIL